MFDHIRPLLKDCGLTHRECEIYLALLSLGEANVQDVSETSDIPRTACYPALESLIERHLVSQFDLQGKTLYKALSPDKLKELLASDIEKMRHRMEQLNHSMAELLAAYRDGQGKPRIAYVEGMQAILALREEIAMSQEPVLEWFVLDEFLDSILEAAALTRDRHMRLQHGRTLVTVPKEREIPSINTERFEVRVHETETAPFSGGMAITGNKAYLFTHGKEPTVLVIESSGLRGMLRAMFEFAWSAAKPYQPRRER